ncbi:glutathione s-transferase [Sarocladium implicatum]|nr:glutathione s-transferase [Sarocladium implicatum]
MSEEPPYELIYWPIAPGRGEFIRLAFEDTQTTYIDVGKTLSTRDAFNNAASIARGTGTGDAYNPPSFTVPILRHGKNYISQTSNILLYLAMRIPSLLGNSKDPLESAYRVNALTLTALERLQNEVHNVHHPINTELHYEDQQEAAGAAAEVFLKKRLPLHLRYFERVLTGEASGDGPWLWDGSFTYADLVLFHCLEGTQHQFPKAIEAAKASGKYQRVFALQAAVRARPNITAYFESGRRQPFGPGVYRYYAELDLAPAEDIEWDWDFDKLKIQLEEESAEGKGR